MVVRLGGVTALPNRDGTLVVEVLDAAELDQARRRLFDATHAAMGGYREWPWHITWVRYGVKRDSAALLALAEHDLRFDAPWTIDTVSLLELRAGATSPSPSGLLALNVRLRRDAAPRARQDDSEPAWRVLLATAALHACNDAFFYVLYPLLPFIAAELSLSYTEVGLVNLAFAGSSGLLQLPAGLLGQRWGEYALLVWGNAWVAAGLGAMAAAASFPLLLGMAVLAGLGGNLQHPLAASLVARAYAGGRRGLAIGTLNFAGDLGKLAAPGLVTVVAPGFGWRVTLVGLGLFGVLFSAAVGLARRWVRPPAALSVGGRLGAAGGTAGRHCRRASGS